MERRSGPNINNLYPDLMLTLFNCETVTVSLKVSVLYIKLNKLLSSVDV